MLVSCLDILKFFYPSVAWHSAYSIELSGSPADLFSLSSADPVILAFGSCLWTNYIAQHEGGHFNKHTQRMVHNGYGQTVTRPQPLSLQPVCSGSLC